MNTLIASLISVSATAFWLATLLGLPGNWGLLLLASVVAYFASHSVHVGIELPTLIAMGTLALVGEVLEFIASAAGASRLGGTRRGSALSVLGSILGAILGVFVGVPVPFVGSLIAALLFGALGAFGGAVAGERWAGKDWEQCIQIGLGALCGKLLGTILKTICGTAMMVLLVYAVWC